MSELKRKCEHCGKKSYFHFVHRCLHCTNKHNDNQFKILSKKVDEEKYPDNQVDDTTDDPFKEEWIKLKKEGRRHRASDLLRDQVEYYKTKTDEKYREIMRKSNTPTSNIGHCPICFNETQFPNSVISDDLTTICEICGKEFENGKVNILSERICCNDYFSKKEYGKKEQGAADGLPKPNQGEQGKEKFPYNQADDTFELDGYKFKIGEGSIEVDGPCDSPLFNHIPDKQVEKSKCKCTDLRWCSEYFTKKYGAYNKKPVGDESVFNGTHTNSSVVIDDLTDNPLLDQVGGDHYKKLKIQPIEYIDANDIPFIEGCIIKYATRWREKGGIEDLLKIKQLVDIRIYLEKLKAPEKSNGD